MIHDLVLTNHFLFRSVRVLRRESSRYRYLKLCLRPSVYPQQLQGGAPDHQDCGGGEALHTSLRGSRWLAQTLRVLDDSGKDMMK